MSDPHPHNPLEDEAEERQATLEDWINLEPLDAKREYMHGKHATLSSYEAPITLILLEMMWDLDCMKQDIVMLLEKGLKP